jgi:alpha-ketoglutarate-dependent taurine dioxygenase
MFGRSSYIVSAFRIRPLHPVIGAEVEGLELRDPLDTDTISRLRAAFDDRGVLVLRGLDIDEDLQRYLVFALVGETPAEDNHRRAAYVSNRKEKGSAPYGRLLFHCDNMWSQTPQRVISLYGLSVEPPSAPTQFVSMAHAWDTLPAKLRTRLEGLEARHGFGDDGYYPNRGGDADVIDAKMAETRSLVRPVGFRHPRTGRRLLYVSQQSTLEIVGLPPAENEALLAEIFAHLYRPKFVLEHDWREGDLVVWDNIATQHGRGTVNLQGPERTLRKVFGPISLDSDEVVTPNFSKVG